MQKGWGVGEKVDKLIRKDNTFQSAEVLMRDPERRDRKLATGDMCSGN